MIKHISEISSFEEGLTNRIWNRMKTWIQRNNKQKIVTDANLYLCEHYILGSSIECLYEHMLLYPFEEQFNLPFLPVQLGNGQCLKPEVVGEEAINCICTKVFIRNKSKGIGILLGSEWLSQFDRFVREKSSRLVNLCTINNIVKHIFFCSCYKKGIVKMKMLEQRVKLDIPFVHKIIRVGFYKYLIHNFGNVNCSFCQMNKCLDGIPKIHQGMHLDCSLMMKLNPRTKFQTQLNSTTIKGIDYFIQVKSKSLSLICFLCLLYQNLCKVLMNTPTLLFIRYSQGGFWHYLDTKTVKVRRTKVKCSLYVSKPGPVHELSKAHYHELVMASEIDGMPVTLITIHTLLKFICVYKRHNLRKYCFFFVHSLQNWLFVPSCKTMISNQNFY